MIRFEQVVKQYAGGTTAVDNLSFEAPTGQITVLVGPSGCGKTTSLRMINRMIEPTSGHILIDDEDVQTFNAAKLRRGIGYVIQHAGLFPNKRVVDNVATVPQLLGTPKAKARERAREVLELVGLPGDFADRWPSQLSGGQQQRVGVARALAADPPVMLMDEPFSAVDPVVREQLQDEFLRLQRDLGKTIVFVTHDIDEALKLGDQIAVMRVGGKLAQLADPAYLLAHPIDDFVAEFVGRDRGYRALTFAETPPLPLATEATVPLGTTPEQARAATDDEWLLVVDKDRPVGWIQPHVIAAPIESAMLHRGGTVARASGPLRSALDAALSSPSRRGVIAADDGTLLGTVRAHQVLQAIEATERPEVDKADIAPQQTSEHVDLSLDK
ncbi:proline/glycine betaine ABC transporter ATP-binding protein [Flexivirga endophytica]|uniref:ABC-type quaternary amine transporter n=1 Tax=Flexivirga endophytica TaxID=1849103 RepID=A0A916T4B0_9MICO|nr:ATP-binding cassette domain-containing protein [Flexivirga endophytica]GGB30061.1 proline/glycine betaine ABC transporter ATP-binding protein [Flexivirga endophytica]GHB50993.1 proline/glycine betaine ABC transporter ATP-binding protein [Flexivirga endophytica]